MSKSGEFLVRVLKPTQWKEVLNFINIHFVPYEMLARGVHATPEDLMGFHEQAVKEWLSSDLSVAVVHEPSESLAGVCLNKVLSKQVPNTFDFKEENNNKAHLLLQILGRLESEIDILKKTKVDRVLEIALLSVDKKFSGKGLSYKLIQESEILAKKAGCKAAYTQATGLGSQHIFEKLGFEKLKEIIYEDFQVDGKNPFDLAAMMGVKSCVVLEKKLDQSSKE